LIAANLCGSETHALLGPARKQLRQAAVASRELATALAQEQFRWEWIGDDLATRHARLAENNYQLVPGNL
jgi:hypothetical protein